MPTAAKPRAVVCDDDPVARQLERGILTAVGFDVIAGVTNAVEALQVVSTYQPDVLVLDLGLPGTPGETIIQPVREVAPGCAVVICSAFDTTRAIENGAIYVINKGANKELEAMLARLAKRKPSTNR